MIRDLLAGPTPEAARAILGARLVRDDGQVRRAGRIVEVEAYVGEADQASHARFGRTARNAIMYGPPGRAYVYLVYGMHDCLNVVTEPADRPAALLIRAVEPEEGIEAMRAAHLERELARRRAPADVTTRARIAARLAAEPSARIASGPGRVASAFGLDRSHTGMDLTAPDSPSRIEPGVADEQPPVVVGPRIGIGYAAEPWRSMPWRFAVRDSPAVSSPPPTTPETFSDSPRTPIRNPR